MQPASPPSAHNWVYGVINDDIVLEWDSYQVKDATVQAILDGFFKNGYTMQARLYTADYKSILRMSAKLV